MQQTHVKQTLLDTLDTFRALFINSPIRVAGEELYKTGQNVSNVSTEALGALPPTSPNRAESTTAMTKSAAITATIHALSPRPKDDRPTAKDLMLFIAIMRRTIRRTIALHDQQRGIARRCRRQARKLRGYAGPFDGARIAAWEAAADDAAAGCKTMRECLKTSGRLLTKTARMFDAGLTLEQRCEILNVNKAHRGDLTGADGLIEIVYMHGLEDSAARVKDDWKDGPLFQAAQEVFMDFLTNTAEGQKLGDSLFERGGMFADVPLYTPGPDGTMKSLPPRLYVVPTSDDAPAGAAL
jgi:hypothetical protein